jgi:3-hydroxy-9,10-secoandrosta-1,3,5(10)-triene-9,17-dione monooxygenase reductase component
LTAEPELTQAGFEPEPRRFRQVLGHFCTGVTVITALAGDKSEPVGFACQSFAAVSLDPPLVLFCPSRTSATWPRIERAGHFCANVLTDGQRDLSRGFGVSAATGADKFAGLSWRACSSGAPVLEGALTWVGCAIQAVHEAGDHYVVIGRVTELGDCAPDSPLLFYRGRYAVTAARSPAEGPPEVVDTLLAWPRHADWI